MPDIEVEDDDDYIPEIEEILIIGEEELQEDNSNNQAENDDQTADKNVNECHKMGCIGLLNFVMIK